MSKTSLAFDLLASVRAATTDLSCSASEVQAVHASSAERVKAATERQFRQWEGTLMKV